VASDLNFTLHKGDFVAIVGVNGIGKSTLLRTLGGVQDSLSGAIYINGKLLANHSNEELAIQRSLVLTEPLAAKNLTAKELISLGRQPYTNWLGILREKDREVIKKAIEGVGITSFQDRKCFELSDGQLQKVLIARALAQDTPVILMDEPTTHLDLYHKVQILQMIKQIAHDMQKTVVYTTHEIDLAIQLCDKILILDKPENHFGTPCELIENNSFQTLFPEDLIRFDPNSGSFKIKN
jgi:iron complex transport system ATP-binding protein